MTSCNSTHNCSNCPTRQTTEWRDLSAGELVSLDKAKRSHLMEPGENVYFQGDDADGVYCIQSGLIGLRYVDNEGNSALIRLHSEGTTIGYGAFLSKQKHVVTAEVLTPSIVCFLGGPVVSEMLAKNPKVGERFLQHSIQDMTDSESALGRSLTGSIKLRFLHLMMVFYERLGYLDDSGISAFELPIMRRDIAELLGAQPESISRLIRSLQDEGLVQFNGKHVGLVDMNRVQQELGISEQPSL